MLIQSFDVIVLGAGAAGLMCAIEAGKRGRRVAVIERNDRIGKKILISGGGRCNFTNLYCEPDNFISANPYFCKSALARYTPQAFIDLVEKRGIAYHEKTLCRARGRSSSTTPLVPSDPTPRLAPPPCTLAASSSVSLASTPSSR